MNGDAETEWTTDPHEYVAGELGGNPACALCGYTPRNHHLCWNTPSGEPAYANPGQRMAQNYDRETGAMVMNACYEMCRASCVPTCPERPGRATRLLFTEPGLDMGEVTR